MENDEQFIGQAFSELRTKSEVSDFNLAPLNDEEIRIAQI
jgi:hypothetical protein